jgi:hypothetical protein
MERSALHWRRLVVPGAMLTLLGLTVWYPSTGLVQALAEVDLGGLSGAGLIGLAGGALYTIVNARERLSGFSWDSIRANIEDRLIAIFETSQALSPAQVGYLKDKRRLLDLFYRLLDNDESLRSRQNGVRFNGLLVTSAVDLSVVALFGWGAHFVMALARRSLAHMIWTTACFLVWVLSQAVLVPLTLARHLELSNEQLDYIATHYRRDVLTFVESLLKDMPPDNA